MRSRLERITERQITDVIRRGWGLLFDDFRYFPEGGGAYHWHAVGADGRRWFVTCDDLDTKPWLGSDRDEVFEALLGSYGTAVDLRARDLTFVVAPVLNSFGRAGMRVDGQHSVSVFAHVDGEGGHWGEPLLPPARSELVAMLAQLHQTAAPDHVIPARGLDLPGREQFDAALEDLAPTWEGGPLSDLARAELAGHADLIRELLADLDGAAARLRSDADVVITHGEPHPGNLIISASGLALVDWDTVARARPERDLWMLADDASLLAQYRALTGHAIDADALSAYRLLWALADLASFTAQLRGEHEDKTDSRRALAALQLILDGREPDPYGTRHRVGR